MPKPPIDTAPDESLTGALTISSEKVCFVIVKAREFEVKDVVTEPDPGSNPADDQMISVLEDHGDDPVLEELRAFMSAILVRFATISDCSHCTKVFGEGQEL